MSNYNLNLKSQIVTSNDNLNLKSQFATSKKLNSLRSQNMTIEGRRGRKTERRHMEILER